MDSAKSYAEITHESRNPVFRFSHRKRLSLANEIISPQPGERILDFGGGDGFVVAGLAPRSPETAYTILEPFLEPNLAMGLGLPTVRWVKSEEPLGVEKFDKILCLEVLEHLSESAFAEAISLFRKRLKPGGRVILSVPLEVGPPALFKNAIRFWAGRLHANTTLGRVLHSAVFRTAGIPRPVVDGYVPSHIGFDAFAAISRVLEGTGLRVEKKAHSPLGALPWFVNSQIYFVLRH